MGKILTSLDWYSAMFYDHTVREVVEYLGIDFVGCFDELYQDAFTRSIGFEEKIVFRYNGISIECPYTSMIGKVDFDDISVLEVSFPTLRLDISGSGLRWLRGNVNAAIDDFLRTQREDLRMKVTRSDFAFDLIDYKPHFLADCINFVYDLGLPARLQVMNKTVALTYSVRTGDQSTLYIGNPSSEKLLRIYDKKMQYSKAGVDWVKPYDLEPNVETPPDSWIRIELQTRRGTAQSLLYGEGDYLSIFKYIYEHYCFRDTRKLPSYVPQGADFWDELFNWTEIEAIIQNANSVQYRSYSEKVSTSVYGRYFSLIVSAICRDGLEGFLLKLNQELYSLQVPKVDEAEERLRNRRYLALIGKLNELSDDVAVGSIQGLRGLCYDRYKKIQLKKE